MTNPPHNPAPHNPAALHPAARHQAPHKPAPRIGPRWESAVEQEIRAAINRGEFDGLSGSGEPIDGLDEPHDELWWVKDKLRREELAVLPPSLAVRRDRDQLIANLHTFRTEAAVRAAAEELNERIRKVNRYGSSGPPTSLMPQDVAAVVARWREAIDHAANGR